MSPRRNCRRRDFPSAQFARALDDCSQPGPAVRATIRRLNTVSPEAELSLRAFYALSPPAEDPALAEIASYLGAQLTPGVTDDRSIPTPIRRRRSPTPGPASAPPDEIRMWPNDDEFLPLRRHGARIRRWICDAVVAHLQSGPYGLVISARSKARPNGRSALTRCALTDVDIERARGGGVVDRPHPFRITATDENAVMIRGILAAADGGSLDSETRAVVLPASRPGSATTPTSSPASGTARRGRPCRPLLRH